ncbi:hypothetical protein NL473_29455, partial [Klebsiella pneumoniae]|nr:hypothetical protein [Klebsiella pneumoniae]MCP6594753.1 hypothetical protein [Klebsiella pneumoniae]
RPGRIAVEGPGEPCPAARTGRIDEVHAIGSAGDEDVASARVDEASGAAEHGIAARGDRDGRVAEARTGQRRAR